MHALEQTVNEVDVVDEAAEERLGERPHDIRCGGADGRLDLLGLRAARRLEHLVGHVTSAHDLARSEIRHELGVVHDDADIPKAGGRLGELLEHPFVGGVEPLHGPHLYDAPRTLPGGDDRVRVSERDAERLLDEDVDAGVESGEHDLCVSTGRRANEHGIELALIEKATVVGMEAGDAVARAECLANGRARLGEADELEEVGPGSEVVKMHRLGDKAAPDDAHPQPQASTRVATFRKARAISSRSCSSQSGETSMWTARSSRSSVCGHSGRGVPAAAIASRTGCQ